jgi:hypothetical protein
LCDYCRRRWRLNWTRSWRLNWTLIMSFSINTSDECSVLFTHPLKLLGGGTLLCYFVG